ncbi:MAG: hypothetical protein IAG10_27785 [Planctomycetaceae bacterium]|nr:hypothetical protein [Planctomycetaceae bacterium]
MTNVTQANFGLLIAYLLPGACVLVALAEFSPIVRAWLLDSSPSGTTVGGFLYATLASVGAGLTLSTLRWLILDTIHHHTGVELPNWNFGALQVNFDAFEGAVENHYRYYQFYGNTLLAMLAAVASHWLWAERGLGYVDLVLVLLMPLYFLGSRDALKKYYARSKDILQRQSSNWRRIHDKRMASKEARDERF